MRTTKLGNKAMKAWRGHSPGFTLIEVLIALALFTIIAFVFAGGLSTASRAVLIADVRTRAESLARTQMEYVKSQNYTAATQSPWQVLYQRLPDIPPSYFICSVNTTTNQTAYCGNTPSMSIIAVAWNSAKNQPATSETGLQKITLVIGHDDREVITLEGYKRNPET
jgi:prepilin-type N-terminal cleavage/methylation domain-containing protein